MHTRVVEDSNGLATDKHSTIARSIHITPDYLFVGKYQKQTLILILQNGYSETLTTGSLANFKVGSHYVLRRRLKSA